MRLKQLDRYGRLIGNKGFSDVSFIVEGKTLQAHKCILAQSSPVFAAMFQMEMKEKKKNVVQIIDIKHNIFAEMLHFIYAGKVNEIGAIASELLIVADKYALNELKMLCKITMCENLNSDNVLEFLKLADRLDVDGLKAAAIDFIASHSDDVVDKPEFKKLTEMPDILFEVCQSIAKKKKYN